jgi:hypothetical protein
MSTKKDFRKELEKLISKFEDSLLAKRINDVLKEYDQPEETKNVENPFGVDLTKVPEVKPNTPQPPQAIPANIGNVTTQGWSNPFAGTSWGV